MIFLLLLAFYLGIFETEGKNYKMDYIPKTLQVLLVEDNEGDVQAC